MSLLCKIIDEEILPGKKKKEWKPEDLVQAVQIALMQDNTNFESLVKNLENHPDLYELVFRIIMNEKGFSYNRRNPVIHLGTLYGILKEEQGRTRIHNRLYVLVPGQKYLSYALSCRELFCKILLQNNNMVKLFHERNY